MQLKPIGSNLIQLHTVISTNNYVADLLKQGKLPNGTVIMAENQTAGRGQRGRFWESEPGKNLTFSVAVDCNLRTEDSFELSMMTALSIAGLLDELNFEDVKVKWPNDIYVKGKKIAGILIETFVFEGKIRQAIIGIGLNVNQKKFSVPQGVSMLQLSGREWNKDEVFDQLMSFLNTYYLKVQQKISLKGEYMKFAYRLNEWDKYLVKGEETKAKIIDFTGSGLLVLEMVDGSACTYDLKEIVFI